MQHCIVVERLDDVIICPSQAEECGENTQLLDDALYALQGLSASASPITRQDSALALADIAATQRGRRTLR